MSQIPAIALLGGTFDPPHLGHLAMAQSTLALGLFERCLFIPCHTPVHKAPAMATPEQRLSMLELLLENQPDMAIEPCELSTMRPRYTVETLQTLRNHYPHHALTFVIGCDGGRTLTQWHHWQQLLELSHILVIPRNHDPLTLDDHLAPYHTDDITDLTQMPSGKLYFLNDYQPNTIASTPIRQYLQEGNWPAVQPLLKDTVLAYIKAHQLYTRA